MGRYTLRVVAEIRVHLDSLRYTRNGLETVEPLPVEVGQEHQVVLVRPALQTALCSYAGFPLGLAFPKPSVLGTMLFDLAPGAALYQFFGHCDPAGGEGLNKALADRRARVALALSVADVDDVLAVADEEGWPDDCYQVLLQALGCEPGPIDGKAESQTQAAVERFQTRYLAGAFAGLEEPRHDAFPNEGVLDAAVKSALIESIVHDVSPRIERAVLHVTKPFGGCAAFNQVAEASLSEQRRLATIVHASIPPHVENVPCEAGDAQACPIIGDGPTTCSWYREHVVEPPPSTVEQRFFRPGWLVVFDGKRLLLSVLTTLPDEEEVRFTVHATRERVASRRGQIVRNLEEQPLLGITRMGVAQVVWEPPPELMPDRNGRVQLDGEPHSLAFVASSDRVAGGLFSGWPLQEHEYFVRLHDADGEALAGERFEVEFADGSTRAGQLDEDGTTHLVAELGGAARFSFLDLDAVEWSQDVAGPRENVGETPPPDVPVEREPDEYDIQEDDGEVDDETRSHSISDEDE